MEHRLVWRIPFTALAGYPRLLLVLMATIVLVLLSIWVFALADLSPAKAAVSHPSPAPDTSVETYYRPF